jgi:lactoylglutathione lyase
MLLGPIKTITVYVENQARAEKFYTEQLGCEIRRKQSLGPGGDWIEVAPPGAQTALVLYPKALMAEATPHKIGVVFHAADPEGLCRELEAKGVRITMPPKRMPWGTFFAFADLDGNEFGVTSQELA